MILISFRAIWILNDAYGIYFVPDEIIYVCFYYKTRIANTPIDLSKTPKSVNLLYALLIFYPYIHISIYYHLKGKNYIKSKLEGKDSHDDFHRKRKKNEQSHMCSIMFDALERKYVLVPVSEWSLYASMSEKANTNNVMMMGAISASFMRCPVPLKIAICYIGTSMIGKFLSTPILRIPIHMTIIVLKIDVLSRKFILCMKYFFSIEIVYLLVVPLFYTQPQRFCWNYEKKTLMGWRKCKRCLCPQQYFHIA